MMLIYPHLASLTQKMAQLYLRGLLLLAPLMVISEGRDVSSVLAFQEEDVALPCVNSDETEYRVRWIKRATNSNQTKVILARPKTEEIQDAERVRWEADGNGQISLFLTKLQKSDEGLYSCEICHGWDCTHVKNISLKVKECKNLPALKPAPGTAVNLICPVNMTSKQQGIQNISWVKLKGGHTTPVRSIRVERNGTSLAFQSVTYNDSGWYSCRYTLGQTQRCFDINLLVQMENAAVDTTTVPALTSARPVTTEFILASTKEESNWPYIAASVTTVLVIIAAVIGLFIYRRRNAWSDARQTQRHWAGNRTDSLDEYENVHFSSSEDPVHQRVNSIYQQYKGDSMCTFDY